MIIRTVTVTHSRLKIPVNMASRTVHGRFAEGPLLKHAFGEGRRLAALLETAFGQGRLLAASLDAQLLGALQDRALPGQDQRGEDHGRERGQHDRDDQPGVAEHTHVARRGEPEHGDDDARHGVHLADAVQQPGGGEGACVARRFENLARGRREHARGDGDGPDGDDRGDDMDGEEELGHGVTVEGGQIMEKWHFCQEPTDSSQDFRPGLSPPLPRAEAQTSHGYGPAEPGYAQARSPPVRAGQDVGVRA
jgi:hypothetical protein